MLIIPASICAPPVPLRDEVLDELVRKPDRPTHRYAEADEVFGVHGCVSIENGSRRVRAHSECAVPFRLRDCGDRVRPVSHTIVRLDFGLFLWTKTLLDAVGKIKKRI